MDDGLTVEDQELLKEFVAGGGQIFPGAERIVIDQIRAERAEKSEALYSQRVRAHTTEHLVKLEAQRKARDEDRALRMAQLDALELSASAEAFLAKLNDRALSELDSIPDPVPVIDGLLYRETTNYLVGGSGAYKTVVAVDMAARVGGNGSGSFCGMPVTEGRSLYIIAEGVSGMKSRKVAWEEFHNNGAPMKNVTFIPFPVQIHDLEAEMPALIKFAKAGRYDFIVFDTQAMCTIGVDENSNDEMALVADATMKLAWATGGCVLTVHHAGKADASGMRGASGMYANTNTVIVAKRDGSERAVTLSTARAKGGKQKDADEIDEMECVVEKATNNSVVLATGSVKANGIIVPDVSGRHDVAMINILLEHQNLGATKSELKQYADDAGLTSSGGQALTRTTVHRIVDRLVGLGVFTEGPRFRVTALGHEALRAVTNRGPE